MKRNGIRFTSVSHFLAKISHQLFRFLLLPIFFFSLCFASVISFRFGIFLFAPFRFAFFFSLHFSLPYFSFRFFRFRISVFRIKAKQAKETPLFRFKAKRISLPFRFKPKTNGAPYPHQRFSSLMPSWHTFNDRFHGLCAVFDCPTSYRMYEFYTRPTRFPHNCPRTVPTTRAVPAGNIQLAGNPGAGCDVTGVGERLGSASCRILVSTGRPGCQGSCPRKW